MADIRDAVERLVERVGEVVLGQEEAIADLVVAVLVGGHVLLEGVPGVAKTLLARTVAAGLGLGFRRIQFTPDLMPADVVGTHVFDFQKGAFHLQRGPVFTQVLLADEINRAPPKTQAALLEAMQEGQVTIGGETLPLPRPFLVVATRNPIDHEGTYPLPEAQLDRFLLMVRVGYPAEADELRVYEAFLAGRLGVTGPVDLVAPVLEEDDLLHAREALSAVHVDRELLRYLQALVQATRERADLVLGASPRAALALLAAARGRAAVEGRDYLLPDDIKRMAVPVLAHRLQPTADAELEGRGSVEILRALLEAVPLPRAR